MSHLFLVTAWTILLLPYLHYSAISKRATAAMIWQEMDVENVQLQLAATGQIYLGGFILPKQVNQIYYKRAVINYKLENILQTP